MVYDWRAKFKTGQVPTERDYDCLFDELHGTSGPTESIEDTISPYMRDVLMYGRSDLFNDLGLPPNFPTVQLPSSKLVKLSAQTMLLGANKTIFNTKFAVHPEFLGARIEASFSFFYNFATAITPSFKITVNSVIKDSCVLSLPLSNGNKLSQVRLGTAIDYSVQEQTIVVTGSATQNLQINPVDTCGMLFISEY